jgi:GT2 family glycosyltransferase
MKISIGVVIVHYGEIETTHKCINSLRDQCDKIVVVDNHGNFRTYQQGVVVIQSVFNIGYGGGCNIGARYLILEGYSHILFLNNDLTIEQPDFINRIERAFIESVADIISPCIKSKDGIYSYTKARINMSGGRFDRKLHGGKYVETEIIAGNCFAVTADAFLRVMFREDFFMYCEDLDFSIRAKAAGLKSVCDQYLYAVHKDHLRQASSLARYYHTRNIPYVMTKYVGGWWLIYYFAWFVPVRVIYFLFKLKPWSALAVVLGVLGYIPGEKGK